MMQYEFSKTCSFERDISDTSMEHDAVSTRLYPKKLIAYIRGDYKNQWWTSYFGVHGFPIWIRLSLFARVTVKIFKAFGFTSNATFATMQ